MDSKRILNILKDNKQLSNPNQELIFLKAVRELEFLDSTMIAEVFALFSDTVENDTPLKYLANLIATSDWKSLLPYFISSVPYLKANADSWLNFFLYSALDENELKDELLSALNRAPVATQDILWSKINEFAEKDLDSSLPPELLMIEENVRSMARLIRSHFGKIP